MAICRKCNNQVTENGSDKLHGLCEDCYLETKITRKRKTHWQYIRSIKTEYLMPGKKALNNI